MCRSYSEGIDFMESKSIGGLCLDLARYSEIVVCL